MRYQAKPPHERADVVGIFPGEPSIIQLLGAMLLEANDEWQLQHHYMQVETMAELLAPDPGARSIFHHVDSSSATRPSLLASRWSTSPPPIPARVVTAVEPWASAKAMPSIAYAATAMHTLMPTRA